MEEYDLINKIQDKNEKGEVIDELKKINGFKLDYEMDVLNVKEG